MSAVGNLIQIKRSNTVAKPSTLNVGELAWSNTTGKLYIGAYGTVTAIGGTQNPGYLTANQALVANSTGGIDYVVTSNLIATSITANGVYSPGAGYLLSVDGSGKTYWVDPNMLSVGPEYVQNTDSRTLSGNLYFSGANVTIDNLYVGSGILSGNGYGLTSVNAAKLGGQTLSNIYDTANNYAYAAAASAFANSVLRTNAAYTNATAWAAQYADMKAGNAFANAANYADQAAAAAFANSVLRSDAAYTNATSWAANYADMKAGDAYANSTAWSKNYADMVAGSAFANAVVYAQNAYANATNWAGNYADMKAGDAYTNATAWASSYADMKASDAYSNATSWAYNNLVGSISNSDYSIVVDGSATAPTIRVKIASGNGIHLGMDGIYIGQNVETTADVTFKTGNFTSIVSNTSITGNNATIYHDLVVGGNLLVTGNVISSNIESIQVSDPLLHLGTNNHVSDVLDIGFFADYYDGVNVQYTGLVRDASDKIYKLFQHLDNDPNPLVNFNETTTATLQAYLLSGALASNGTVLNITANNTLEVHFVANTLSLTTPLAYDSGGTGFNSYADGDLLLGNATTGLTKLSSGSNSGYVLQTDGMGGVSWASIDGGTFS